MPFYAALKLRFHDLCQRHNLVDAPLTVKVDHTYSEHSGSALAGRTRLIADFLGYSGMSHTFHPFQFDGTVGDLLAMDLEGSSDRAVFIAGMNAVCSFSNPDLRTLHCSETGSVRCTQTLVEQLRDSGYSCPGLIGFQPSLLKALSESFGTSNIVCVDQDDLAESVRRSADVNCLDEEHLQQLLAWSDVLVVTGATLVSGLLPNILEWAEISGKPVLVYGTSIAGAAELMDLPRFCPESRAVLLPS